MLPSPGELVADMHGAQSHCKCANVASNSSVVFDLMPTVMFAQHQVASVLCRVESISKLPSLNASAHADVTADLLLDHVPRA